MKFNRMRWQEIADKLPQNQKLWGVEIGVWTAKTSQHLLDNFPLLTLYMIDPYADPATIPSFHESGAKMTKYSAKLFQEVYEDVRDRILQYGERAVLFREMSEAVASRLSVKEIFDFVFVDGDHSREGVYKDIKLWLPFVKPGGFLMGHDYGKSFRGVKQAVDELLGFENIEFGDDTTWFYRKP